MTPTTSAGRPWAGETWRCALCPAAGPDRDDLAMQDDCPRGPRGIHIRLMEVRGWEVQDWQLRALEADGIKLPEVPPC